jgi:hypothetical protein
MPRSRARSRRASATSQEASTPAGSAMRSSAGRASSVTKARTRSRIGCRWGGTLKSRPMGEVVAMGGAPPGSCARCGDGASPILRQRAARRTLAARARPKTWQALSSIALVVMVTSPRRGGGADGPLVLSGPSFVVELIRHAHARYGTASPPSTQLRAAALREVRPRCSHASQGRAQRQSAQKPSVRTQPTLLTRP